MLMYFCPDCYNTVPADFQSAMFDNISISLNTFEWRLKLITLLSATKQWIFCRHGFRSTVLWYWVLTRILTLLGMVRNIGAYSWETRSFDKQVCTVPASSCTPQSLSEKYPLCSANVQHTIRDAILTCARRPTWVSLIYRTETTTKKCKTEKN